APRRPIPGAASRPCGPRPPLPPPRLPSAARSDGPCVAIKSAAFRAPEAARDRERGQAKSPCGKRPVPWKSPHGPGNPPASQRQGGFFLSCAREGYFFAPSRNTLRNCLDLTPRTVVRERSGHVTVTSSAVSAVPSPKWSLGSWVERNDSPAATSRDCFRPAAVTVTFAPMAE